MSDIRLIWDEDLQILDWAWSTTIVNGVEVTDLDTSNEIETYILICLFTDRKAEESYTGDYKGGNWYDTLDTQGSLGTRLYQLWQMPVTDKAAYEARATDFCKEGLSRAKDDGIVDDIGITCTLKSSKQLQINIEVVKNNQTINYSYMWNTTGRQS